MAKAVPVRVRPSAPCRGAPVCAPIKDRNMKKYIITFIILLLIIIIGASFIFTHKENTNNTNTNTKIIFFYSDQCPHCAKVEAYLKTNNIRSKVKFEEKEVLQNKQNLQQLVKIMDQCKIPTKDYVEVPLLWTGSKCLVGEDNIINFFKEKTQ